VFALGASLPSPAAEYLPGGPLAGVPLPLWKTSFGEPPGYPGWFPGGEERADETFPEIEPYPGAAEHFRAQWMKYCPVRGTFDRQSQLKNWVAPSIPVAAASPAPAAEQYRAPVCRVDRQSRVEKTDQLLAPRPVLRCRAGSAPFELDLGELEPGVYALRVIGAVEPKECQPFAKALFLRATVNDAPGGGASTYRQRLGYCEEFYPVAEIYFHATEKRPYRASLQVDAGSAVDLLVHNVTLDDVLAGTVRRALKTRALRGFATGVSAQPPKTAGDARLARDAVLWNAFVPINFQGGTFVDQAGYGSVPGVTLGTDALTGAQIEEAHGPWTPSPDPELLLVNKKLGLRYTMEDYRAGRPLPDPYPLKDDGRGLTFPSASDPKEGRVWAPIAAGATARVGEYLAAIGKASEAWVATGDSDAAHDGAVRLARFAYAFPTLEDSSMLNAIVHDPGAHGRGHRCRSRETSGAYAIGHFGFQFRLHHDYDRLFPYVRGNEALARSIGRFVPWVKTPEDVVRLLDVYLLQVHAKRHLRYQYYGDGREPSMVAEIAAVLGDHGVTNPWMEWLFSRTFYYPHALAGLPDYLNSITDRDGRSPIGSSSYVMHDESAAQIAASLELYAANGGDPKYRLLDLARFPKIRSSLFFPVRAHTAGLWTMRVGNVSGPDKGYAKAWEDLSGEECALGWKFTRDPAFAWTLARFGKKEDWSDAEWAEIGKAAAALRRGPWMDNPSRVLPGWAAFLETGLAHDDLRFRRSVMLRVGIGDGHAHADPFDLQVHAHGLPMTIDAGQRPGYSKPPDLRTRVHNTVEVDGQDWQPNPHVAALGDLEGARWLVAEAAPNPLARHASRLVALVDVDEGKGSQALDAKAFGPKPEGLPKGVVTPNSYVFDVFRVAGGNTHTWCFHAHVNDPPSGRDNFQPTINALDPRPVAAGDASPEGRYLEGFSGERFAGKAPAALVADFRLQKQRVPAPPPTAKGVARCGTEAWFAPFMFDPASPDKHTRVHLLGSEGAAVMKGDLHCQQWGYSIPNLFVQRRGGDLESAFAAVVEPYSGQPFLASVRRLPVEGDRADAQQAVAVEVKTANGRTDFCFSSGRPTEERRAGEGAAAARFAYWSTDADGLRQVSLGGGTLVKVKDFSLKASVAERRARIVRVDYASRKAWIDQRWPASRGPRELELKTQPLDDPTAWQTSFTAESIQPEKDGSAITFTHGANAYRGSIRSLNARAGRVEGALRLAVGFTGYRRGWTASNATATRTWRVDRASKNEFFLVGDKMTEADFAPENVINLWEYGVGDELRLATGASARRVAPGQWVVEGDADLTLALPGGKTVRLSADEIAAKGGRVTVTP
jgi:hypothetical protein